MRESFLDSALTDLEGRHQSAWEGEWAGRWKCKRRRILEEADRLRARNINTKPGMWEVLSDY